MPNIVHATQVERGGTAIQEAINSLHVDGGIVYIDPGTWILTEPLRINSNVTLEGFGGATRLVLADGSDCDMINNADMINGNQGIIIRNLSLNGNGSGQESGTPIDGIKISNSEAVLIENVFVKNVTRGTGINLSSTDNSAVKSCFTSGCADGITNNNGKGVVISGNGAMECSNIGITSFGSLNTTFGNVASTSGANALLIYGESACNTGTATEYNTPQVPLTIYEKAVSGDIQFRKADQRVYDPVEVNAAITENGSETIYAYFLLTDADHSYPEGTYDTHAWFNGTVTASITATSTDGVAAIADDATSATVSNGTGGIPIVLTGTWAEGDSISFTVSGSILGYTLTSLTHTDAVVFTTPEE
jgi:hypothetical protein